MGPLEQPHPHTKDLGEGAAESQLQTGLGLEETGSATAETQDATAESRWAP